MKKIRFESDNGYVIEFSDDADYPYILEQFDDGLAGEASSIKIPGRDGRSTYNLKRAERKITVDCAMLARGSKDRPMEQARAENRNFAARSFDPKYFGTLYYYSYPDDNGKKIRCKPTGTPAFEPDFNNLTKFRLGFESDDSIWEKATPLVGELGTTRSNHRFPHFAGRLMPFAFVNVRAVIYNDTLYDISPVVYAYNSEAPVHVVNIKTGKSLRFKCPTGKDRRLVADIRNAAAILEEYADGEWVFAENVIHYLELDSRLTDFVIVPGENEFKLVEMSGQAKPVLKIEAHEPVLGV